MFNLIIAFLIFSLSSGLLYSAPLGDDEPYCSVRGSFTKSVKNMDKGVGPFTPEQLGGCSPLPRDESPPCISCENKGYASVRRKRALRDIGIHCGRCHRWATDAHLVLREKLRLIPMIKFGHGLNGLSAKRKVFLLEAFIKDSDRKNAPANEP